RCRVRQGDRRSTIRVEFYGREAGCRLLVLTIGTRQRRLGCFLDLDDVDDEDEVLACSDAEVLLASVAERVDSGDDTDDARTDRRALESLHNSRQERGLIERELGNRVLAVLGGVELCTRLA